MNNPLAELIKDRERLINEVVLRTTLGNHGAPTRPIKKIEEELADSLFWEKKRLEEKTDPLRDALDHAFWKDINSQYMNLGALSQERGPEEQATYEETLRFLHKKIIRHHLEEIAGNFNQKVYGLAAIAIPRGLGWLLQALSWKSVRSLFLEKVDLRRKVHFQGQIDLMRRLSQKGTVILVPTHFSNLDSMLIGWALHELGLPPFSYGAGLNLFTNPVFGYFMNNLGAYKIDRRKKHSLYKEALKHYSTYSLEKGCHGLFFPGGGRSRSGGLEKKLKLGLLGTAIDAYIGNLLSNKINPNIYIIPCVISYHFVLEAATLIDDFLMEHGKSRYIIDDDESSKPKTVAQFLYNFLTTSSSVYLNFGTPIDPFGNIVNEDGQSIGPSGSTLDITTFVKSNGEVCYNPQRDAEYTKLLGERITQRYLKENIALTSHFIAYAYFEFLRMKHSPADLFKLLRLDKEETSVSFSEFSEFATPLLRNLHEQHRLGKLYLEPALRSVELRNILEAANRNLGIYHAHRPLIFNRDTLFCEDMKLLYYYHNRMEGYQLCDTEKT